MRLGLIARADNTGLGNQTWEYARWLNPHRTLIVDITNINERMGKSGLQLHPDRFSKYQMTKGFPVKGEIDWLLSEVDVVLTAETPYNYYLFDRARELGKATVLHYNFEFLDHLNPNAGASYPTMLLAPSSWRADEVVRLAKANDVLWEYLPLGVNREVIKPVLHTAAKTFVHIVGQPAHEDRNGTIPFLNSLQHVKSQIRVILYMQNLETKLNYIELPDNVTLEVRQNDFENYWQLYHEGDVLVMPRKYGGQSMVLNEAQAAGMAILMSNCSPQSEFLHRSSLIPSQKAGETFTRTSIDLYECSPEAIAAKMDELAGFPPLVRILSEYSLKIAESQDWQRLKPEYERVFEQCFTHSQSQRATR